VTISDGAPTFLASPCLGVRRDTGGL
jgi:hypothetical protein